MSKRSASTGASPLPMPALSSADFTHRLYSGGLLVFAVNSAAAEKQEAAESFALSIGVVYEGDIYVPDSSYSFFQTSFANKAVRTCRYSLQPEEETRDFSPRMKIGENELMMVHASTARSRLGGGREADLFAFGVSFDNLANMISREDKNRNKDDKVQLIETHEFTLVDRVWRDSDYHILDTIYMAIRRPAPDKDIADPARPFANCGFFFDFQPVKQDACDFFVLTSESLQLAIEMERKATVGKPVPPHMDKHPAAHAPLGWQKEERAKKAMLGVWHKDEREQWALIEQIRGSSGKRARQHLKTWTWSPLMELLNRLPKRKTHVHQLTVSRLRYRRLPLR